MSSSPDGKIRSGIPRAGSGQLWVLSCRGVRYASLVSAALDLLRRVPMFGNLSDAELVAIAGLAQRKRFEARHMVVQQSDPGGELFVIIAGFLKVISAGADGRDTALGIMGPGEVFGEVSVLDGGPRSATVCALEHCELLAIRREPLLRFLESSPKTSIQLLKVLTGWLRRLTERSEDIAFLRVGDRLAKRLAGLADKYGAKQPDGTIRIPFKLSQQEIGELVSATRESANKQIKVWEQAGLLSQQGGYLIVHDVERLREASGE
jgi:CRP/FNR family transcriptional regulator, cyclic AMP receptor protein